MHTYQTEYYRAIEQSTAQTDVAPFVTFMLTMIRDACAQGTPQVTPDVTPQVKHLLDIMQGEMKRDVLMRKLKLKDPKHFRQHYLLPALKAGLIEMTQPDRPTSPTQQYRLATKGILLRQKDI